MNVSIENKSEPKVAWLDIEVGEILTWGGRAEFFLKISEDMVFGLQEHDIRQAPEHQHSIYTVCDRSLTIVV